MPVKRSVLFGSLVAEGSRYQVGQAYAAQLRQNPLLRQINLLPEGEEVTGPALRAKMRLLEAAIPGLGEEIAGTSEALGIRPGRLAIFSDRCCQPGRCSQIAALPAITRDGHLYLARSYEYGFADELCLCVTRAAGSPAQAGFSLLLFGRMDGMNDRGLCVTMSTCSFLQPAEGEGLWFPVVLRALLERCATVAEASDLLAQLPLRTNDVFLLADRGGRARVAEMASVGGAHHLSFRDSERWLVATNHYQNEEMRPFDNHRGRHSVRRWKIARRALEEGAGRLDEAALKALLERPMPGGVACPYYQDGLGTLRSMLFDVTAGRLEVCFGAPTGAGWTPVSLQAARENRTFSVEVESCAPQDPASFWTFLPPGDEDEGDDWQSAY
nr:C45 family peptidase [Acetanaerobacterium sp. MSJ-12]